MAADGESLQSQEIAEKVIFSQGVNAAQDKGEQMKAVGQYEVSQLENDNKNIMTFSSAYFVPEKQA